MPRRHYGADFELRKNVLFLEKKEPKKLLALGALALVVPLIAAVVGLYRHCKRH